MQLSKETSKIISHERVDQMLEEFGLDILKVKFYRPKLSLFLSAFEEIIAKEYMRDPNEILEEAFNEATSNNC